MVSMNVDGYNLLSKFFHYTIINSDWGEVNSMYSEKTKCLLRLFEIDHTYQGYEYCVYCMELISKNSDVLTHVTKLVYPEVAKKFNTSCHCVERNIRTIAETVWKNGGKEYFSDITGYKLKEERPSNSKFLELLANCIILKDYPCNTCELVGKLSEEVTTLQETTRWMHDLIWELVRKCRLV